MPGGGGAATSDTLTSKQLNFSFWGAEKKPRTLQPARSSAFCSLGQAEENVHEGTEAV